MSDLQSRTRLDDILPLAPLQEGLLFHALYNAGQADEYTTQTVLALDGELDPSLLKGAAEALLQRHANLRAAFRHEGVSRPVQLISRDLALPWSELDLSGLTADERERRLGAWLAEDWSRGFDVTRAPLLRFALVRTSAESHRLVMTNHHILLDGWSKAILLRELFDLYEHGDRSSLPPVVSYREYLAWLARQDKDAACQAWRDALARLDEGTLLFPSGNSAASGSRDEVHLALPASLGAVLRSQARANRWTVNIMLQGAWGVVLSRLAGRDDVVFGTTVSGRPADVPGAETMIGLLINTVPVRVRVPPGTRFMEVLDRLQRQQTNLLPHQHLSITEIQRLAGVAELFDTMFVFENYPPLQPQRSHRNRRTLRIAVDRGRGETHYPLSMTVGGTGDRVLASLGYRPDRIDRRQVTAIASHFQRVLTALVEDPSRRVDSVSALDPSERRRILVEWNATRQAIPDHTVIDRMAVQVENTPDAAAIIDGQHHVTYAAMNARANRLAHRLIAGGCGPENIVGVVLERSSTFAMALAAVWKAGAAVLPLDPALPPARLSWMLREVGATAVVTTTAHQPTAIAEAVVLLDDAKTIHELRAYPSTNPTDSERLAPLRLDHPAYVIYTSGSTGPANGVVVSHRALANKISTLAAELEVSPSTRWLATTNIGFDPILQQLLVPLICGGATVIVSDADRMDPRIVRAHMERSQVSIMNGPPAFLSAVLGYGEPVRHLKVVISGGDRLLPPVAEELRRLSGARLLNLYGPTETCIDASQHDVTEVDATKSVPIGVAMPNYELYVLDDALEPTLPHVTGELYIGGVGLARGYASKPALTASRFVANPHRSDGARIYRTGDLVRWRLQGQLEFIGRADRQVKLRGFRVEPAEIEAALMAIPVIQEAAVIVTDGAPGERKLVAYVVGEGGSTLDVVRLRSDLADRLPAYLVPAAIVPLGHLPRTSNGKIDHNALPAPDYSQQSDYHPPRTADEARFCKIFADVLGLSHVGIDDDFFEMGGDSLLAMRVIGRLRDEVGLELTIRNLFERPTIKGLLAVPAVDGLVAEVGSDPFGVVLPIRSWGDLPPLFCVHPAAGLSWCYGLLLRHLEPNRPIYGLQSRGFRPDDHLPETMAQMAADYIGEMRTVQASGPYHLAGWSFGGEVAYTIATLLQSRGEEVALLALMDAGPSALAHVRSTPDGEATAKSKSPPLSPFLAQFGVSAATQASIQRITEHTETLRQSATLGCYRGDMVFFLSTLRAAGDRGIDAETARTMWSGLVIGDVRVYPIAAQHHELMAQPQPAAEIGRVLSSELAQIRAANQTEPLVT